ncbi:glutathione binding-like protein [soil metagenome]
MSKEIQLYSLATPNGQKVGIALEEMGLAYTPHTINIGTGDQFKPEFIAVNPNSKIPAIVDPVGPGGEPISVFESGAILVYLARKSGEFLPKDPRAEIEVLQWLFFQMAGVGPMFGQFGHFFKYAVDKCDHPYPLERYTTEAKRLLGVLEARLANRTFLVGEQYSIADMATVPWVNGLSAFYKADAKLELEKFVNVNAWTKRILDRPKTAAGMNICKI